MKVKLILILICILPFKLFAQQQWDLKDCIAYGLKNNRSGVVYENEKKAADAKAKEALAAYLPSLNVSSSFDDNLKVQQSIIPAGIFGPDPLRISLTQRYNTNSVAELDQTIFDQTLLTGLKANKYSRQQADLNIKKNEETVIYNIGNDYYQTYVYREQLRLLRSNLEIYYKQMKISQLQVQKGISLQKDLDRVTVNYNNAVSQIRVAESNLTLARNQLKYDMGFPISTELPVDTVAQENLANPPVTNVEATRFSPENRTDYQLSEINSQLLNIDQKRIKAGALPTLTGYAKYGEYGYGTTIGPAFNHLNPYSAIGLKLSILLFNFYKRNAQYNQAKYKSMNALENLKLDSGKYALEYQSAITKLVKAQSNLESDKRNIELAESVFMTTDLQYKKGVTDLTDWLDARTSVKDAQNNYLNSLYTFYQAKIDLEKASGNLKNFYSSL
ncbi:outer membrane protein TolC [Mucilaginibacter gracilis]|uniref:Outer membrane protein TolC n=1 Tax=Mucilaginibacter gracilis TaxID=423350 RepID=A0A495J111_9SPHI|nr:TolC family protein [Mucilaginibacter gracilis]RKR82028.1 outer membrane protein TolC [Mucilaginibacter gracilis]